MIKFQITLGKQANLFAICVALRECTPDDFYQLLGAEFKEMHGEHLLQSGYFCFMVYNAFYHYLNMMYKPFSAFTHWCRASQESQCLSGSNRFDRSKRWLLLRWHDCWLDRASRNYLPVWT